MNRQQRAKRALTRQLAYQEKKAASVSGREQELVSNMKLSSAHVRGLLEAVHPIDQDARALEVGSGAHGLIFYFGIDRAVGVDPLAASYAHLFSGWQRRVPTVAAFGEALPFPDSSFHVVLSHNVVDHAESPAGILAEIARVMKPSGLLYFTVNVHHPIYALAAWIHAAWNSLGINYEIGPFADHTVHLTLARARRLFDGLPLRLLKVADNIDESRLAAKQRPPRHAGDKLKRIFFKNAVYEVIAMREG
jgi:SAM-dependent methyltransferase